MVTFIAQRLLTRMEVQSMDDIIHPNTRLSLLRRLIFICLTLCVAACVQSTRPNDDVKKDEVTEKEKTENPYLNMTWGGFIIIDRKIAYKMDYDLKQAPTVPQRLVFEFENPDPQGNPVMLDVLTEIGETSLSVTSKALEGIRNDASYKVVANLYEGEKKLTSVTNQVYFKVAPSMLDKLGIRRFD